MCAKMLNLLCGGSAALTRENRDFLRFCNCFSQKNLQSFKRFRIRQRLVFLTPLQSRHTLKICRRNRPWTDEIRYARSFPF